MSDTDKSQPDIATEAAVAVPATVSVGRQLRAAREAAGQSVADVAQAIKYSPRQIELIEADNYAAMPGITVVRGFVRSYGRFLQLDVDTLLRLLDERLPNIQADVRPPENMGAALQPGASREFSLLATLALVVSLAALLLVLWHYFGPSVARPSSTATAPTAMPAGEQRDVAPPPAAAPPESAPPAIVQEEKEPQLRFMFEGRSWVEVTDGSKRSIHTGENPAGSELKLEGTPPFDIVVGNAPKVRLIYGGQPVDLVPHTRADVARMKLE